jgi:hypothetical protein
MRNLDLIHEILVSNLITIAIMIKWFDGIRVMYNTVHQLVGEDAAVFDATRIDHNVTFGIVWRDTIRIALA